VHSNVANYRATSSATTLPQSMPGDLVIACDAQGNPSGRYLPKIDAHAGNGTLHLAIAVLLYNREGQALLQLRKHPLFNGSWDLTGATHPLFDRESGSESFEVATRRCLAREYGIANVPLRRVGAFTYTARDGGSSENEYCVLLIGEFNGGFQINPAVAYGYAWIAWDLFLETTATTPSLFTPWAVRAAHVLRDAEIRTPWASNDVDQPSE
jgi:isopentenyldiphosphate isomerase